MTLRYLDFILYEIINVEYWLSVVGIPLADCVLEPQETRHWEQGDTWGVCCSNANKM